MHFKKLVFIFIVFLGKSCISYGADEKSGKESTETVYYVGLPLTAVFNPIFDSKKSYCSKSKFNEENLCIKVQVYTKLNRQPTEVQMPLSIFRNNDGSFKKYGEKVVYKRISTCDVCSIEYVLTIDEDFATVIDEYYQAFIKHNEQTCILQ